MTSPLYDIVGIGAGPANLSLAALAEPLDDVSIAVLEREGSISWHPGMMFAEAHVQTVAVKDLVSLVDPTNPYSFLNFLVLEGRLYRHLIAARGAIARSEFDQYYAWAARRLPCVSFGAAVEAVEHDGSHFVVHGPDGARRARNVVLGVGQVPHIPEFVQDLLCPEVFHCADYLLGEPREIAGRDVLLVGGGQSAADVVLHILARTEQLPRRLTWVSGRAGFLPRDDSPFTNEWFNPRYVEYFHGLSGTRRRELVEQQTLASDGLNEAALLSIYRRLYELDYLHEERFEHEMLGGHRLVGLDEAAGRYRAAISCPNTGANVTREFDTVILATGYRPRFDDLLWPLKGRLRLDDRGGYRVGADYRLEWDGPEDQGLFVQNGARETHGVADANLSLMSWRSAVILNRVCGRQAYSTGGDDVTVALGEPAVEAVDPLPPPVGQGSG